jgi:hypothetical protein
VEKYCTARKATDKNIGPFIMYSGITKIYYRKTGEHVVTKPVQNEGTTEKLFSQ